MSKRQIKIYLLAIFLIAVNACSEDEFGHSLNQYCHLYSPESLASAGQSAEIQEVFGQILKRQKNINNKKMQEILSSADNSSFENYYASVKAQIEEQLGQVWNCVHFEQFFLPKQKVISLSLKGVQHKAINPHGDNIITIMLAHSGEVLLNNAPLKEPSLLKAGLESKISKRPLSDINFVLYFDEGSNGELVSDVLATLVELGVESVDLIDL